MTKKASEPDSTASGALPIHGARSFPGIELDSYSLEIEDEDGFAGDKANKSEFLRILDEMRKPLAKLGEDPLGRTPTDEISRKKLATILAEGEPEAAALVQSAVEQFAQQLHAVIRRFLKLKDWRDTESIVVGGGFRGSRIGELAIARAGLLLKDSTPGVNLELIHHDPDEAGLIGTAYLLPAWMMKGHDAILAADIGGTNIRCGIVELNLSKASDLSRARVAALKHWCHQDEEELSRAETVAHLGEMLERLMQDAKKQGLRLAPLIGMGCPGVIREDGSIARGAHNLPGDWESGKFNLPAAIRELIPRIGEHETLIVLHNDAVVQGLSEVPHMRERGHWAVLTIGTGLGNARFTNRERPKAKRD